MDLNSNPPLPSILVKDGKKKLLSVFPNEGRPTARMQITLQGQGFRLEIRKDFSPCLACQSGHHKVHFPLPRQPVEASFVNLRITDFWLLQRPM